MLADVLIEVKERVVDELERRAATTEAPDQSVVDRRQRLNALIEDVVEVLRVRGVNEQAPVKLTVDPTRERIEGELARKYLMDQIARQELRASLDEVVVLSEWFDRNERRHYEEEKRQLSTLLDGVNESAAILAPDGHYLYVNRHGKEMMSAALGVGAGDIVGKTPAELHVTDESGVGRSAEAMLEHALAHASFEVVVWGRAKELRFEAIYGPDGTVAAVALVVEDVHDRKLALTRLGLLSKLSTLVGRVDYNGLVEALAYVPIPELADWCAVNLIEDRKIYRTFIAQRDPAKAPLRNALMRAIPNWNRHPLWREMLTGGFQLLTEVSDQLLRIIATNDEQYRLLSLVGIRSMMVVPLVSRGRVAGIITLAFTTESGRRYGYEHPALAEEFVLHAGHTVENARLLNELRASEARFHVALSGARTIVYEQDPSLRYVSYYNPMVQFSLVGKTHEDVFPPADAAALNEMKKRVIERGESVYQEIDLTIGNDERRHFREAIEPRRDPSGKVIGVTGAATDLTEQQRTQQQLREAIGFRDRMMGILGHDLRSPLSTVTMAGATLLGQSDLPAAAREPVLRIRRAADRMAEMIDTLLDFTRAWFLGKVPISPIPIDLCDVARGLVDELRGAWPEHPIDIDARGDCHGLWDPARMSQMISNLVGNALAYGDPGSTVHFSLRGNASDVTLKVHNGGPSIPSDLLPVLFEPFRRGVPADRSPHGLGLGLYIVQQIVLAHGGTIVVESTPEEGTTFTVHLPRDRAAPGPPAENDARV